MEADPIIKFTTTIIASTIAVTARLKLPFFSCTTDEIFLPDGFFSFFFLISISCRFPLILPLFRLFSYTNLALILAPSSLLDYLCGKEDACRTNRDQLHNTLYIKHIIRNKACHYLCKCYVFDHSWNKSLKRAGFTT